MPLCILFTPTHLTQCHNCAAPVQGLEISHQLEQRQTFTFEHNFIYENELDTFTTEQRRLLSFSIHAILMSTLHSNVIMKLLVP
jgi:hypothetical protein